MIDLEVGIDGRWRKFGAGRDHLDGGGGIAVLREATLRRREYHLGSPRTEPAGGRIDRLSPSQSLRRPERPA